MNNSTLPPQTSLGAVYLTIPSLERSIAFYKGTLGFHLIRQTEKDASLGTAQRTLLVLNQNPAAKRTRGVSGLYHFAVRLPTRRDLARMLLHLSQNDFPLQGVGDHGVSESLYLADVDGNGIELYADRPLQAWPRNSQGSLRMGTDSVDVDDLMQELGPAPSGWTGLPLETIIGHIHLHVGDLAAAEKFYLEGIGFDLIQQLAGSASFFSAGGYHHHVAVNTWAGIGAPPPPPDSTGLYCFELVLPSRESLSAVLERVKVFSPTVLELEDGWLVRDPSKNGIYLRVLS